MADTFDPLAYSATQAQPPPPDFDPLAYSAAGGQVSSADTSSPPLYDPEGDAANALAEGTQGLASIASAGAGTMLGGFRYATGMDRNASDVGKVAKAFTYTPSTQGGRDIAEGLSTGASYLGQKEGMAAGDWMLDKTGSPVLASAANTLSNVPQFLIPDALGRLGKIPEKPVLTPQEIVNKSYESQSMGAAGVAPDISKATPELKQAIVDAGPGADREVLQRHLEADTLPIPAKLTRGQATQDAGLISTEQNARGGEMGAPLRGRFQEQNQNLIDNLDEIRREAAPTAVGNDHIQNGQALLDKYKEYDEPIRADVSAKYKALADANGGELPMDGESFVSAADAALKKSMKAPFLPAGVRSILDTVREGGNFTFENFENLRTTLAAEARKADRGGDGNAAAAINLTRDALEQMPATGATAAVKGLADTARSAARARFEAIEKDPAYKAAVNDDAPKGEQSPMADKFVQKYVLGGTKSGLQSMQEKFAGDPEASGTIKAAALNYLKNKAGVDAYTNTGNFSQSGFNKARAELEPRMDALLDPQTAQHVRQLGNVARYQQMQPRGAYVNNSNTLVAAVANRAKMGAEDIANAAVPGLRLGTAGREMLGRRSEAAEIQRSLEPGAGIKKD